MQQLLARSRSAWENARTSLWFIPAILVTAAITLSFTLLYIDRTYTDFVSTHLTWLFSGTPSSAQQILTSIAGAVITVVSISFSLTIIAMQQAAVQYTPRVLRNFTSDKGNQLVLGFYIATFTYSLLVLRAIRTSEFDGGGFIPSVSLSFAFLFALICMGLLVYFINHIATSLQASTITSRVHQELLKQIDTLYPEQVGKAHHNEQKSRAQPAREGKTHAIRSSKGGYVTRIDDESLQRIDFQGVSELRVTMKVGDFVSHDQIIAYVTTSGPLPKGLPDDIRKIISITHRRSVEQDPLFAIRQLVDTALKGLSPGINDITTSNYCVRYLGDALGVLANRSFPSEKRVMPQSGLTVYAARPTWDDFVTASFKEILRNIKDNVQVLDEVLATLSHLARRLPDGSLSPPIKTLLDDIVLLNEEYLVLSSDKIRVAAGIAAVRTELADKP